MIIVNYFKWGKTKNYVLRKPWLQVHRYLKSKWSTGILSPESSWISAEVPCYWCNIIILFTSSKSVPLARSVLQWYGDPEGQLSWGSSVFHLSFLKKFFIFISLKVMLKVYDFYFKRFFFQKKRFYFNKTFQSKF